MAQNSAASNEKPFGNVPRCVAAFWTFAVYHVSAVGCFSMKLNTPTSIIYYVSFVSSQRGGVLDVHGKMRTRLSQFLAEHTAGYNNTVYMQCRPVACGANAAPTLEESYTCLCRIESCFSPVHSSHHVTAPSKKSKFLSRNTFHFSFAFVRDIYYMCVEVFSPAGVRTCMHACII